MASGDTLLTLFPNDNEPPSASAALYDVRNNIPVLKFQSASFMHANFTGIMPSNYGSGSINVYFYWGASPTTTSGSVCWSACFEAMDTTDVLGTDSFAASKGVQGVVSGSDLSPNASIAFTNAEADAPTSGCLFRIRVGRMGANASDVMSGASALLYGLELREG